MNYFFRLNKKIKSKVFKRPSSAVIETTNRCNLNCPYCMVGVHNDLLEKHGSASHDLMRREMGQMGEDTFNDIVASLTCFGIREVFLHFQGEPLLNPRTTEFAKILKDEGLIVNIFTNGLAFNDETIQRISEVEINKIRFSIDGASKETYEMNRVGGDYHKVIDILKKVCDAHRTKKTHIEWQFVAMRNNEHEIEKAKSLSENIGANFVLKGFRETDPVLRTIDPRYHAKYLKKPCKDIYRQVGIYWNGDVVPCCYDTDGSEIMGNLSQNTLEEIWNSQKFRQFRTNAEKAHMDPDNEPGICKTCLRWK